MIRVNTILKQATETASRSLRRDLRIATLGAICKTASDDQHGIFQHFQGDVTLPTRERYFAERGGEEPTQLYGVGPEHEDMKAEVREPARSLSTRYSPDRVGVQTRRISDGVVQDPYTQKQYDWKEGFKTEDGEEFPAGGVSLQTDVYRY